MSAPVLVGTVIAERYRVEGVLGEGGMGVVVRATHLLLQQQVAIKFLRREAMDADAVQRLLSEAQSAARVQSEHVVRVHDVAALDDGTPYIVMEYLEGHDLATILASGPLPVRDAVRYAIQACEALGVSHAAGVVHGDLKPENIYIARTAEGGGKVKLLDFGIAKGVFDVASTKREVMGTPAYMAPEQFEHGTVDPRTDFWSLGAVLYEMLSGTPPFTGATPDATANRVVNDDPAPIRRPGLPAGLEAVIQRCLNKDPHLRFGGAMELALALEPFAPVETSAQRLAALSSRTPMSVSQRLVPTVVVRRGPGHHRGGWLLAIAGGIAVASLVVLVSAYKLRGGDWRLARTPAPAAHKTAAAETPPPAPTPDPLPAVSASAPATVALVEPAPAAAASTSPRGAVKRAKRPGAHAPPDPPATTDEDRYGTRK